MFDSNTNKVLASDGSCRRGLGEDWRSDKTIASPSRRKIKFRLKALVFISAVISLSWFFEGWRRTQQSITFEHIGLLLLGTTLTLLCLGVYSYWIYIEEKSKGTLKKRIALFEKILAHRGMLQ